MQRRKRTRAMIAAATIAVAAVFVAACGPVPGPASAAAVDIRFGQNYLRALYGRGPLNFSQYLEDNAQLHEERPEEASE